MLRRLPVYLIIDCSHSMRGEPIAMVKAGIDRLIHDLRNNPMALETVWLSIITFSTGAEQLVPLTDFLQFEAPVLTAKGKSDMGAALRLFDNKLDSEVQRTTEERKGDWRPIAFLMTDGGASDAWVKIADKLRERQENNRLTFIAADFGEEKYADRLKRITPQVIVSDASQPASFAEFLAWVSTTIGRSVQAGPVDTDFLERVPEGFRVYDG